MAAGRPSTWLITGASSGLGNSIALKALAAGHKVIGATRDVEKAESLCPEFSAKGGIWLGLDPAQKDAYDQFSKYSQEYDVDVLVNSARYAIIGGIEDTSEDEVRDQMEVNFYGALRSVRGCLPTMRAKRSGHVVLLSSIAGFMASPGRGTYSASKFAIEAVHESLFLEVMTFGIKVLIVELGAFRTPFSRFITPAQYEDSGFRDAYKGTVIDQTFTLYRNMTSVPDFVKGDPDKAAQAIIEAVDDGYEYLRMPLGTDCVEMLEEKIERLRRDLEATRGIAKWTEMS